MPANEAIEPAKRAASERSFVHVLMAVVVILSVLPTLLNWASAPSGHHYLGIQYNLDDHMVYAAWMRQAMDGQLLFDNRFTTDAQPGLTIHVYFLVLGWLAKVTGIPFAMALARMAFSALFVSLLYRIARRMFDDVYTTKLAVAIAVFGGGIGFALWHTFGQTIERPAPLLLRQLLLGRLPTDVWQPEGFVFPSMLTSGLFSASLCLIATVFLAFLNSRESWKWVPTGFLAVLLLVNIHTYDAVIIGLALLGALAAAIGSGRFTFAWLGRSVAMLLGAVPPLLWLLHVLRNDEVFQARAATLTYSPNFRQVVFGYLGLLAFGLAALYLRRRSMDGTVRSFLGLGVLLSLVAVAFVASQTHTEGYFVSPMIWLGVVCVGFLAVALLSTGKETHDLVASWAVLGLIAIYLPALFQRKLAMGLAVPWALLAAYAIASMARRLERNTRNFALALVIVAGSTTSILWLVRERQLAILNVSNTAVHSVYLSQDAWHIITWLEENRSDRTIVLAMPGQWFTAVDDQGQPIPDSFVTPYIPDLNPFLSGLAGVYTYAGHWSETPAYGSRRTEAIKVFLRSTQDQERGALIAHISPDYIVAPVPSTYPAIGLADLGHLGEIVYEGPQLRLIRVRY